MTEEPTTDESQTTAPGSDEFAELRKLDAQYQPIDLFEEWASLHIDEQRWQKQASFLEERRITLPEDDVAAAIQIATRAAAVDTGAIEGLYQTSRGLTNTIALQEPNWETTMRSQEERLPHFLDAHLAAFDLASEVAANKEPVTEKWIRDLHEVITGPQAEYDVLTPNGLKKAPLPKGKYKTQPNHVNQKDGTKHAHAPVDMTPTEMHRLVEEMKTPTFEEAQPVLQAAYVHYALVAIHPFADGNGRVARSLASVYLRRGASIPLLVWADQRTEYFDALEAVDKGDRSRFVEFLFDRSIDALTFVANKLGPEPERQLAAFEGLYISYGGLTFEELNAKASELNSHTAKVIRAVVSDLQFPKNVQADVNTGGGAFTIRDASYRHPTNGEMQTYMSLSSSQPANAQVIVRFHVLVSKDEQARYAFRIESSLDTVAAPELRLRDVHPKIADGVTEQIKALGIRALSDGLAQLSQQAAAAREAALS